MELTRIAIVAGGVLSLLMAAFHIRFYALFGWHREFEALSARSRRIVFTIHLALLLAFVGFGAVTLAFVGPLARADGLAFGVDLFLALFWGWRTVWQVVWFRPPPGPKGRTMRRLHVGLTIVFGLLAAAYAFPIIAR